MQVKQCSVHEIKNTPELCHQTLQCTKSDGSFHMEITMGPGSSLGMVVVSCMVTNEAISWIPGAD